MFTEVPVLLAHGALGWWDELIFVGVAIAFVAIMVLSWFRSRSLPPDDPELPVASPEVTSAPDRFKLD